MTPEAGAAPPTVCVVADVDRQVLGFLASLPRSS
jgi:hypothetical protein